MPNMSARNRCCALLGSLLIASCVNASEPGTLSLRGSSYYVGERRIEVQSYSPALRQLQFASGVEMHALPVKLNDGVVVIYRTPTRRLPLGRCGAGTEDFLALVRLVRDEITLIDKLELQSCEKGTALVTADLSIPENPISTIRIEANSIFFVLGGPALEDPRSYRIMVTSLGFVRREPDAENER